MNRYNVTTHHHRRSQAMFRAYTKIGEVTYATTPQVLLDAEVEYDGISVSLPAPSGLLVWDENGDRVLRDSRVDGLTVTTPDGVWLADLDDVDARTGELLVTLV